MKFLDGSQTSANTDESEIKYLIFLIGRQRYGISISDVVEIVKVQPITELPEASPYTKGIINLRGRVVPLIDVNLRFGKPEKEYTSRTCIIIVDIHGKSAGLIVDTVHEVLNIEEDQISPPPSQPGDDRAHYITGIGKVDDSIILLIDLRLMLPDRISRSDACIEEMGNVS